MMVTPYKILTGDCRNLLEGMPSNGIQTCVTSPPYWKLRDYGHDKQIGLESSVKLYVDELTKVFKEIRRVLKDDGTLWLNLGDIYDGKNLAGIPWRVAFALQDDGWILRSDIVWAKPNPMPESISDRPTKAHEYLFLFVKSHKYYYDADAIKEPLKHKDVRIKTGFGGNKRSGGNTYSGNAYDATKLSGRNKRSVWTITTQPFPGAHFAVMPESLVEPCILAGSSPKDLVLDPFCGAATVPLVATKLGRHSIGIELNPDYVQLGLERIEAWERTDESLQVSLF